MCFTNPTLKCVGLQIIMYFREVCVHFAYNYGEVTIRSPNGEVGAKVKRQSFGLPVVGFVK